MGFGINLANFIYLFHPKTIILDDALIHSHELFFQTSIKVALTNTYRYPKYQPHFSLEEISQIYEFDYNR